MPDSSINTTIATFNNGRWQALEKVRVEKRAMVLRLLSDGEPHTALALAQRLGISSAEIRSIVKFLEEHFGYGVVRSRKGFQLKVHSIEKWKTVGQQPLALSTPRQMAMPAADRKVSYDI